MLRTPGAFISLTLLCTLGGGSEAQVLQRARSSATVTTAVTLDPERRLTLVQPLAGPTNLTASGTPAIARLRWDTVPGVIGYHVSRTDPTGLTIKLTTDAITTSTSFEDQSGGVKPGLAYTYHVTAAYPNDGFGTAEVSFTPPAPGVPAWVRIEPRDGQTALVWAPVPDAGSYHITESWLVPVWQQVQTPVYSATGTLTGYTWRTVQTGWQSMQRDYVVTAPQSSFPVDQTGHRFRVGAVYPPSGITAPLGQWPSTP
jgi:hypothetical protein